MMGAVTNAKASRVADERRAEEEMIRRLSGRGVTIEQLAASLEWPGGRVGVDTVLRRLAGDGRAHQRGALWFAGPDPNPTPKAQVLPSPRVPGPPRLTYGPATLAPRTGAGSSLQELQAKAARLRASARPLEPSPAPELVVVDPPLELAEVHHQGPEPHNQERPNDEPVHRREPAVRRHPQGRGRGVHGPRERRGPPTDVPRVDRAGPAPERAEPEAAAGARQAAAGARQESLTPATLTDEAPADVSAPDDQAVTAAPLPVERVPDGISAEPPALATPPSSSSAVSIVDQVLAVLQDHPWPTPQAPTTREIAIQVGMPSGVVGAILRELRAAGAVVSTGATSGVRWGLADDVLLEVPTCRVCGCTDDDCSECIDAQGYPCSWVLPDLCSRCVHDLAVQRLEHLALEAERTAAHLRECIASLRPEAP